MIPKPLKNSEAQHQQAVVYWARINAKEYPELYWLHHIPNGGERDKRTAYFMTQQGVVRGIADLYLPVPAHGKHGLYIEMKADGGVLSRDQERFRDHCFDHGYGWMAAFHHKVAINCITDYLSLDESRLKPLPLTLC